MEYTYCQRVMIADAYLNGMSFMPFISFDLNRNRAVWAKIILSGTKEEIVSNLYGGSCCIFHFKSYSAIKKIKQIERESF